MSPSKIINVLHSPLWQWRSIIIKREAYEALITIDVNGFYKSDHYEEKVKLLKRQNLPEAKFA